MVIELSLPDELRQLVCVVTEFGDDDIAGQFSPAELEAAASLKLERRRIEWLAARLAARRLAERRGLVASGSDLQISMSGGQPVASTPGGTALSVSFSHTAGCGAAALDAGPIGVDLESIRRLRPGMAKFYLAPEEIEMLAAAGDPDALLHAWSAKEAAFKAVGCETLLSSIRLAEASFAGGGGQFQYRAVSQRGTVLTRPVGSGLLLALARPS